MKIKRTLPSVSHFYSTNYHNNNKDIISTSRNNNRKYWKDNINNSNNIGFQHNNIQTSQLNISIPFDQRDRKINMSNTFVNSMPTSTKNQLINNATKKQFDFGQVLGKKNQTKIIGASSLIPSDMNIKRVQNENKKQLKNQKKQVQDINLIKQIQNLQTIVKQLKIQLSGRQKQPLQQQINIVEQKTVRKISEYFPKKYNSQKLEYQANNILQMQLKRIQKCQNIIQENQYLYQQLIHNISRKNNYDNAYRSQTMKKLSVEYGSKAYNKNKQYKLNETQKVVFQDFNLLQQNHCTTNNTISGDETGQIEITSPFLVQQNRTQFSKY